MLTIRDNADRARTIIVIFIIMIVVDALAFATSAWQYVLLQQLKNSYGSVPMSTLQLSDNLQQIAAIAAILVLLFTIIYFIRWFRRGYYNLHNIPGSYPQFSEGWAAGWWFVPFMNLARPYQVMKEIWDGTQKVITHRLDKAYSSSIIGFWWAAYLVSNIYGNITFQVAKDATDIDSLITVRVMDMVGKVISTIAIIITIVMIRRAQYLQQKLYEEALEPGDSVFSIMAEGHEPGAE